MPSKPIARVGDTHKCPIPGHGTTTITNGDSDFTVDDRHAATIGSKTGCGATITEGSDWITVNDKPVAYLGCASDHGGVITSGSPEHTIDTVSGSFFVGGTTDEADSEESSSSYYTGNGYTAPSSSSSQTQQLGPVINTKTMPDKNLRHMLENNREEILLLTPEEAFHVHEWAKKRWSENYDEEAYQFTFDSLKDYSAHAKDAYHITVLIRAFNGVGLQSYARELGGKTYIIFKGYAGLRQILTGPRYLADNAKIIQLGLGRKGLNNAVKSGAILSIFVVLGMRGADYLLRDEATMAELLGGVGLDFAKIGVSTAAAWGAGTYIAGAAFAGAFVLGPLVAVVVVGVLATIALNALDEHYQIEEKVVEFLEKSQQEITELARIIEEAEPEDVLWNMAEAYIDGMLEKGKRVIEGEVRRYLFRKLSELPFYRIQ